MSEPRPDKVVLVDFDGTIGEFDWPNPPGPPHPAAVDLIRRLSRNGYYIVIFTARLWSGWDRVKEPGYREKQLRETERYLEFYHIPYNEISNEKRPCIFILDDRAIRVRSNQDWLFVRQEFERLAKTDDYGKIDYAGKKT